MGAVLAEENSETSGFLVSRSALSVLFSVVFLDNLGFAIVLPYLFFYAQSLGASALEYGALLASYSLLSFIFTPVIARFSDRYGRRRILLVALLVSGVSYFVFGTAQVLWLLFFSRALAGTTAATVPIAQAYVADVTDEKNRLRYLGLLGAAAGIAFIIGPAIGGTLSDLFGYGIPSFLASALAFANFASAFFRLPEPQSVEDQQKSVISLNALLDVVKKRKMLLLLTSYFSFFVAFIFLQSALPPWLEAIFGFKSFETGLVFFFVGGISAFTQAVLLPWLSNGRSRSNLMLIGTASFTTGLLILSFVQSLTVLVAVMAFVSFGFGLQYVTFNTLISLSAPKRAQGGTLGIAWALAALAQTIAPVFATSAFAYGVTISFDGMVFAISGIIGVATVPLILAFKKENKE
jgi:DHA1 family tetracycline resistance protein-like MFS transporter